MGRRLVLEVDVQVRVQQTQKMAVALVLGCECLVEEVGCRILVVHAVGNAELGVSNLPMGLAKAVRRQGQSEAVPKQAVEGPDSWLRFASQPHEV